MRRGEVGGNKKELAAITELERLMFERGISKKQLAEELGINYTTAWHKIKGNKEFTWKQVCMIQKRFFPDLRKEDIFEEI